MYFVHTNIFSLPFYQSHFVKETFARVNEAYRIDAVLEICFIKDHRKHSEECDQKVPAYFLDFAQFFQREKASVVVIRVFPWTKRHFPNGSNITGKNLLQGQQILSVRFDSR